MKKGIIISVVIIVVLVIFFIVINQSNNTGTSASTPATYGTNPITDQAPATPATLEEKQQCTKDGTAWYTTNIIDQSTPQAIAKTNAQIGGSDPSVLTQALYPGVVEYVFSTKLNTCLVDWAQTASMMDGSSFTTHAITDVYTNKNIAEWNWGQKQGQSIQDAMKGTDAASFNAAEYNLIKQQN